MMRYGLFLPALILSATTGAVCAEETEDGDRPALWELRAVGFGQYFPSYPSSSEQNPTLLPLPVPVYRGSFLRFGEDLDKIAEGRIVRKERLKLSVGLNVSFPEDSSDISARTGMPDLDLLTEAGPQLKILLSGGPDTARDLELALQLRGAVSLDGFDPSGRGFVFNPELEYRLRDLLGPDDEIRFRVSPVWASSNYMNYFFGVAPEIATPTRPEYRASSGYLNTELLVGWKRNISDRLKFQASARLWVNKGSSSDDSPLYRRDYDKGIRVAVFWLLAESKKRAGAD